MIEKFIADIKTKGLSRSNRYTVLFSPPVTFRNTDLLSIMLLCDQATLPGSSFSTTQNRSFGEFREVPYEKLYDTATFSFYVDKDLQVKYMFDQWINSIQDPVTRKFNYYDSYTTDLTIDVQDLNDKTRYTLNMFECYPKSINSVQLDYAAKDIMKISVTMQYKYWTSTTKTVLETNKVVDAAILNQYYDDFYKFQTRNSANSGIQFSGSSFGPQFNKFATEFPT
ncbi:tail tube protein [uncultured Caudovirales phage]|uniref:Tail tube protein n=1 Tax=uncultured Caudovirales phage TaxID=2100421 RepID=A0A6J7WZZ9_9CAUD|nr:tail tube protein [uncultured Caudovirales phage]